MGQGNQNYYQRKIKEGKNKMSVINAIRNKLIQRIFAVTRDNRTYVDNHLYSVNNNTKIQFFRS